MNGKKCNTSGVAKDSAYTRSIGGGAKGGKSMKGKKGY